VYSFGKSVLLITTDPGNDPLTFAEIGSSTGPNVPSVAKPDIVACLINGRVPRI